jgi:hypothetical protein
VDIRPNAADRETQEGVFISDFPGYNLLVQSVNGRTNEMHGITIYKLNPGGPPTTILARRGMCWVTPDGHTAVLRLKDGEIHEIPPDEEWRIAPIPAHGVRHARDLHRGAGGLLRAIGAGQPHRPRDERAQAATEAREDGQSVPGRHRPQAAAMAGTEARRIARANSRRCSCPSILRSHARSARRPSGLVGREDPVDQLTQADPTLRTEVDLAHGA